MQKRKNYNLKLPRQFQRRFSKPYDKFVCAILTYADDLTPELIQNSSSNDEKGMKNWLVALNNEDRAEFRKRKLEIMPHATNPQFIDALLLVHERKSVIRKGNVGKHGIQSDNNRMLDNSILKVTKRRIITSCTSYKMNGVELLASPIVPKII
jgi:hypothetical protein